MESERKQLPPYLPYKTFLTFLDHLKAIGVPSHIDKSVMASMSGAVQSWLKSALRYMALINAADEPQESLVRLVNSAGEERKALLRTLFKQSYGFLDGKIDLANTTPTKLRAAVVELGASGETVDKIIAFMIAMAKDANVTLSKLLTTRAPAVRKPRKPKPSTPGRPDEDDEDDDDPPAANHAMREVNLPKSGGTLMLSGTINIFQLVGDERKLVFDLIDRMMAFEETQETSE